MSLYSYYSASSSSVPFRSQFEKFHNNIRLKPYDENATLREKRDRVLTRLKKNCAYTHVAFNQGSYQMRTGVIPLDGDFDIDVGIVFDGNPNDHNAVTVKRLVFNALNGHTKDVAIRRPCVRVAYQESGEPLYHVDLAVYMRYYGQLYLAKGLQTATAHWESSDPEGAMVKLMGRYSGDEAAQFRRVVRYLKRWKDYNFATDGNAAPVGIGLTIAAYERFQPIKSGATFDDLSALERVVSSMNSSFYTVYEGGQYLWRLIAKMPASPHDDVFLRMSSKQMTAFREKLGKLSENLSLARQHNNSGYMRRAFGTAFPE